MVADMSSASVIEFGTYNPRRNLPPAVARKRGESNFVGAFQRDFTAERKGQGVGGRHFELAGYGIADFVWMDYGRRDRPSADEEPKPVLMAFEMKLKDWRRALSQAFRYSYFSDQSIVVLPTAVADRAQGHLHVFERLGIGLWSYDPKAENIDMRFTPAATQARNPEAREKALNRISRKIKLRKLGK
jgi:hypothetical protein